jgi:hypothetical protein
VAGACTEPVGAEGGTWAGGQIEVMIFINMGVVR